MTDETNRPRWWNERVAASWEKAKSVALAEWAKVTADTKKLEKAVLERALAFGHSAQSAYAKMEAWTDQVERDLAEEWERLGNEGAAAWAKIRDTVMHEWQRATAKPAPGAGPDAPAPPAPPGDPTDPADPTDPKSG